MLDDNDSVVFLVSSYDFDALMRPRLFGVFVRPPDGTVNEELRLSVVAAPGGAEGGSSSDQSHSSSGTFHGRLASSSSTL